MRDVTLRFINTLRAAGLRISLSESMDAMLAVAAVGVERDVLREALAASLVKEEEDRPIFDETFSRFFAGPGPRRKGKRQDQAGGDGSSKSQVPSPKSESQKVQGRKSKVQSPKLESQKVQGQKVENQESKIESPESQSALHPPADRRAGTPQFAILPTPDPQPLTASYQARLAKRKAL